MWKWRKTEITSDNISLPKAGKLLKCIQPFSFDSANLMPVGSYVLFLYGEQVCAEGPSWVLEKCIIWLFHFYVNGEKEQFRWCEEVPGPPDNRIYTIKFDWTEYWEYVYPE